jgi:hypothetical protein
MMPAVDPREDARKRRSRFVGIQTVVTIIAATMLSQSRFRGWVWVLWLVSFTIIIVFTTFFIHQIGPPYRRGRDAGSRPARPHRRGRGGDDGDAGGGGEPAVGDRGRPAGRRSPQLPAVRTPADDDDVGP